MPCDAFDPVNKQYADTGMLHIGGNSDVIGGLKVGINDNLPLYLFRNREIYITMDNDLIDCKNHRIINISDSNDVTYAVNKRYVDSKVLTKNHLGYIPVNPIAYGFTIQSITMIEVGNVVSNILNDDINSIWEVSMAQWRGCVVLWREM